MNSEQLLPPIVLFDGVCNFCNGAVNFIIKWNKKRNLRFASMQGETGLKLKEQFKIPVEVDSIVFIVGNQYFIYSSSALRIAKELFFPMNLLYGLIIIPSFLRDMVYKWIARNRYSWFGKRDTCVIPSKEVKNLFFT